jgi:hypothetical protein
MKITGEIEARGQWREEEISLDTGADINVISQRFVVQYSIPAEDAELPRPKWLGDTSAHCYGAHRIRYRVTDDWGQTRIGEQLFYAMDKNGPPLLMGMPGCDAEGIQIDTRTRTWRLGIDEPKIQLLDAGAFAEAIQSEPRVYAMVLAGVWSEDESDARAARVGSVGEGPTIPEELKEYEDVFSVEEAGRLPPARATDHAIETTGEPPHGPLYNLSTTELGVLRRYIDDALEKGWIRRSTSPAGAPVLFVPKGDGSLRLCVDYRGLNKLTVKNRHDEWKTAFRTRYGHFEYMVMPFGLSNAPGTFQAYISRALMGLVDNTCVVYMDDILIYSEDPSQHYRHVAEVLKRLRQFQLFVKLSKCLFAVTEVEFLGFIVSTNGVLMDPKRIDTIVQWPVPKSYLNVQEFLGFTNFYRRFVEAYSKITVPLTSLLQGSKNGKKTGPFLWNEEAAEAFRRLREAFTPGVILIHFDPTLRIRVETDASGFAISGILSQLKEGQWRPVAFYSRKLQGAELNYETHDSELLAIVVAFKQWRHYLEGSAHTIEVLTDHNNLRGFMNVKALNGRQARWAVALAPYDFTIIHRAGKTNPADAPSRRPDYEVGANASLTRLLPTLQHKLQATAEVASLSIRTSNEASASILKDPGQESWWGRLYQTVQSEHSDMRFGEIEPGKVPGSAGETQAQLKGDDDVTGVTGCKQYIPRKVAVLATSYETVYDPPTEPLTELVRGLQQVDELAIKQRDVCEAGAEREDNTGLSKWKVDSTGLLRHKGCLYIPDEKSIRAELLRRHHDDALAGHFGVEKTLELLQRKYFWPKMTESIKEYIKSCDICQRVKTHRHRPYGELQSLPHPTEKWREITMDFITDLPPSGREGNVYDSILVIVDRFTKMAQYISTEKTITSSRLADILISQVITTFGKPYGIVSDRGSVFTSDFWSEFCYYAKVKRRLSTAFHPQTDGQTERQNQTLEHWLRCYCTEDQSDWAKLLPLAEFAYNNAKHASTGLSPFYAMYGYNPEFEFTVEDDGFEGEIPAVQDRVRQIQETQQKLEERYKIAVETQAKYYNNRHEPMTFNKGDLVLLSTKNLKQKRPSKKLSHKYAGPFRVEDVVGTQAYRLALPTGYRIHPTFHVSLLEPYTRREDGSEAPYLPLPELLDDEEQYEVEALLDRRTRKRVPQYLVKWLGWPEEYNQWVPEGELDAPELRKEYDSQAKRKRK